MGHFFLPGGISITSVGEGVNKGVNKGFNKGEGGGDSKGEGGFKGVNKGDSKGDGGGDSKGEGGGDSKGEGGFKGVNKGEGGGDSKGEGGFKGDSKGVNKADFKRRVLFRTAFAKCFSVFIRDCFDISGKDQKIFSMDFSTNSRVNAFFANWYPVSAISLALSGCFSHHFIIFTRSDKSDLTMM